MKARVLAELARIEAATRPAPAAYIRVSVRRRAFTRPRLVADAYAVRETAWFRAEDDAPALRHAA